MLKIGSVRWRGKCLRHPEFDPYQGEHKAVRTGCARCAALQEIHECHRRMLALMREFTPPGTARRPAVESAPMQESLFGEF
jgi:hypothetical protein